MFSSKKRKAAKEEAERQEILAIYHEVAALRDAAQAWLRYGYPILAAAMDVGLANVAAAEEKVALFNAALERCGLETRLAPVEPFDHPSLVASTCLVAEV